MAFDLNHVTFKKLCSFFSSFNDFVADLDVITGSKIHIIIDAQSLFIYKLYCIHDAIFFMSFLEMRHKGK